MKSTLTTAMPVRNAKEFLEQALESVARQTRRPDRVIVIDNCSTDSTPEIAKNFRGIQVEYTRNQKDLDSFGNFNRCLDYAAETDYLHILHADDLIKPAFYETMEKLLEDCDGQGLAWCLDERIDENGKWLSVSGKPNGRINVLDKDTFLARKAEIGNQAFCATLIKSNRQPITERFPLDMLIVGDAVFWPKYGRHCKKIVTLNEPLAQYRWHGSTETYKRSPKIEGLIVDEWRAMEQVEALRDKRPGWLRMSKLKGLMAARSAIKAKRFRQMGNPDYARLIGQTARRYTGLPIWLAGSFLVELRELLIFKIGGRPRHPANVYS
ncbi:MAG TPA: glycosyltransferase family 2 protein [Alphaproteobacteria bacterium]|nr:glycosyltransferase family 2 protein [Alphaproteobacteria bacterium]